MNENPNERLIPVFITRDAVQESLIAGALRDAGLHFVVQNYEDSVFTGVYEQDHGFSKILVMEHEKDEAEQIISNYDTEPPNHVV